MANVGLDGAYPERISHRPLHTENVADGRGLDRIADSGTSAVRLDEATGVRVQTGIFVHLPHQVLCCPG